MKVQKGQESKHPWMCSPSKDRMLIFFKFASELLLLSFFPVSPSPVKGRPMDKVFVLYFCPLYLPP